MIDDEIADRNRIEKIAPDVKTLRLFFLFSLIAAPPFVVFTIAFP